MSRMEPATLIESLQIDLKEFRKDHPDLDEQDNDYYKTIIRQFSQREIDRFLKKANVKIRIEVTPDEWLFTFILDDNEAVWSMSCPHKTYYEFLASGRVPRTIAIISFITDLFYGEEDYHLLEDWTWEFDS